MEERLKMFSHKKQISAATRKKLQPIIVFIHAKEADLKKNLFWVGLLKKTYSVFR